MKEIKKSYDPAEVEVIRFTASDIITASGKDEVIEEGGKQDGYWDGNW